jgi:hypothetical protein
MGGSPNGEEADTSSSSSLHNDRFLATVQAASQPPLLSVRFDLDQLIQKYLALLFEGPRHLLGEPLAENAKIAHQHFQLPPSVRTIFERRFHFSDAVGHGHLVHFELAQLPLDYGHRHARIASSRTVR